MSHNSNEAPAEFNSQGSAGEALPFKLSGSARKTAYALEINVARMIEEHGLERVGFLTLTVGEPDPDRGKFCQVWLSDEASKRINSLIAGLLSEIFGRMVIVMERHVNRAIHFHLIVECPDDIRTGFDFNSFLAGRAARRNGTVDAAAEKKAWESAPECLRQLWGILRTRLPGYGFGRAELTPIYKSGEAISRYVSTYVEKNLFNRRAEDRGKKLVRYSGWGKSQMKPNSFSWATPAALEWRRNVAAIARACGVAVCAAKGEMAKAWGPRWAMRMQDVLADGERAADWGQHRPDEWAAYVVDYAKDLLTSPGWRSHENWDAWLEFCEEMDAAAAEVPVPEPCWEQMILIERPDWRIAA